MIFHRLPGFLVLRGAEPIFGLTLRGRRLVYRIATNDGWADEKKETDAASVSICGAARDLELEPTKSSLSLKMQTSCLN